MLVTTSRYSPSALRGLAKAFAIAFGGAYFARGKKTMLSLVSEARKNGHSRICVAMPGTLEFISVDELGNWEWLEGIIVVKSSAFDGKRLCACCRIAGSDAEKLAGLLDFEQDEKADAEAVAEAGIIKLFVPAGDSAVASAIFEMEVSYERKVQDRSGI